MAASPLYFPDAGAAHAVASVLLAGTLEPDTWVDIESVLDVKVDALRCHESQVGEGGDVVADVVRQRAGDVGLAAGLAYAEGFRRLAL
jgi:LmbE family N-acetylglucosaminyl deacetylase